jgi:hypothetical protein
MKQFSQGLSKTADLPIRPAPERHGREAQADQRATQALGNGMLRSPLSAPQRSLPNWQTTGNPLPEQGGHSLSPTLRAPFEQGFGHDFSQVRIFPAGETAEAVHKAGSRAITCGPRIALAPGQWAPETPTGRALLAHELAHVTQQAGEGRTRIDHKTLDEEIDEELKAKASDPKTLDPDNPEYANTLQDYGHGLGRDSQGDLMQEPKDPKAKAAWKRNFQKVEKLAGRILDKSGAKVDQKNERAQMLAVDLANVGLINEAMALAPKITDPEIRQFVYQAVLGQPAKVTEAQIATIAQDQASNTKAMTDHDLLSRLAADQGGYAGKLGAAKVNAALKAIVKAYAADADLPEKLANITYFHPASRAAFTEWMLTEKRGALLQKVSEQPYFVEGAEIEVKGKVQNPDAATLGWSIGNKQRVTVDDIVALGTAAGIAIAAPAARDTNSLKTWLEANTEKIGQAVNKQHPGDAAKAKALYTQIVEAFTWHLPGDSKEDVAPDKSGHITALKAGGPQNKQLKVDCDVLATYGVRLLVASGFTPIGYMAVKPTDKDRAGHAMALLQQGSNFHAISNSATRDLGAISKTAALEKLHDFGIADAYDADNPLTGYDIYYMDSDAKGTLPDEVLNQDSKARDGGLSK